MAGERGVTDVRAAVAAYDALLAREDFSGAGRCLSAALAAALAAEDAGAALSLYNELMGFERQYGERDRAEAAAEAALALLEQTGLSFSRPAAMVFLNAATVKKVCGKNEEAAALYRKAEACFSRFYPAGDRAFAGLYNNMAALYLDAGDFAKAEHYYDRALGLLRRHGDVCDLAVTYFNLALLYQRMDPLSSRIEANAHAGLETLERSDAARDAYYHYTCRKCAAAAEELGYFAAAQTLTERADTYYAGH